STMSRKVLINKRAKGLSREALDQLSKTELIDKVVQLEAYNFQLKNILQKKLSEEDKQNSEYLNVLHGIDNERDTTKEHIQMEGKQNKQRKFDWTRAQKRHVLLKVIYFGWDYHGFADQEDSNETIEAYLFRALLRTCLIESRAASNYHRCGRTDKEVSAFCQVISIDLRSNHAPNIQLDPESLATEIDYCSILNRLLPKKIQCVSWMPLRNPIFSARFDCISRTYRYYFPKGELDIEAMQAACQSLVCHGDFRNFCKMDVHNGVTNYIRNLQAAQIMPCDDTRNHKDLESGYGMYYLEIHANAFLWHQIRCIMAVLLLVGQKREQPDIIEKLLDVGSNPCKPQYSPAIGLPLNLFQCHFRSHSSRSEIDSFQAIAGQSSLKDEDKNENMNTESDLSEWIYSEDNLHKVIEYFQCEWAQLCIKTTIIRNALAQLENLLESKFKCHAKCSQMLILQDAIKPKLYQPLLQRKRCESLENRIDHFVKKQRLIMKDDVET
ncbi:hypothetical protein KR222_009220, partial [Zaprionus bogoriensis]